MPADHEKFMQSALDEARRALAEKEFPVGCVLVYEGEIIARGRRINSLHVPPAGRAPNELDHAEMRALRIMYERHPGIDRGRVRIYTTLEPCLMCFGALLINNIGTVVYAYEDAMGGGVNLSLTALNPLYRTLHVSVVPHILRRESLLLFKEFFADPENTYWQDSLLAIYTLSQDI